MQPALSQVCSLNSPFEKDVEDYAAGKCEAIELWLGKLEGYLEKHSLDDVKRVLEEHGVKAPVASFQGGLLAREGAARDEHWSHFARRLDVCKNLGVQTLVVAADFAPDLTQADLDRARQSLVDAGKRAADHDVRLAVEFQSRGTFVNNLQTAAALVAEVDAPNVGICFDIFHYYMGPSKAEDWAYLGPHNLFHVQLCDIVGAARELATDSDRVLPGDGDFQIEPFVEHLRAIQYSGCVSVELMNPEIWQIPARQFGEVAMTALRKSLGLATMD